MRSALQGSAVSGGGPGNQKGPTAGSDDRAHLAAWLVNPQAFKPGTNMPNPHLDPQDVADVVEYLEGLR